MTRYRPDIDGLRAVAVVAVVLFHARLGPFTGGFVGVDVFFVISGYLIAGIILDDIDVGAFSIAAFYERRMRRLFPALFALLIACTIAGYFLFLPEEFRKFGQSVAATSAFVSNFLFWNQSGYFDTPGELKPLLHTWSLAVEEQFYLLFPAFLVVVSKYARQSMTRLVLAVALVSFALSAWALTNHPDAAFYLPHTRMWELMIGALLVCADLPQPKTPRVRTSFALIGIVLIAVSAMMFSARTRFPGPAALLPCVGAALIVQSGRQGGSAVHALLATRPLVHVGLISYSLYLWHWPILVFAPAMLVRPLTNLEAVLLVALSFGIADLSWRFVESPFRGRNRLFSRSQIFGLGSAATIAMLLLGTLIDWQRGMPARLPNDVVAAASGALDADQKFKRRCMNFSPDEVSERALCRIGANHGGQPTFILWGDSHANALAPVVSEGADHVGEAGLFAGSGGCAPLLGVSRTKDRAFPCDEFNDRVASLIRSDDALSTVLLASRWVLTADGRRYLNEGGADTFVRDAQSQEISRTENGAVFRRGLERTLATLHEARKRIIVVGPVPEIGFDVPTTLARDLWFQREPAIEPTREAFLDRQAFVLDTLLDLQRQYGFQLIEPHEALCDDVKCGVGTADRPLYVDDNHLSITGARELSGLFESAFRKTTGGL